MPHFLFSFLSLDSCSKTGLKPTMPQAHPYFASPVNRTVRTGQAIVRKVHTLGVDTQINRSGKRNQVSAGHSLNKSQKLLFRFFWFVTEKSIKSKHFFAGLFFPGLEVNHFSLKEWLGL